MCPVSQKALRVFKGLGSCQLISPCFLLEVLHFFEGAFGVDYPFVLEYELCTLLYSIMMFLSMITMYVVAIF